MKRCLFFLPLLAVLVWPSAASGQQVEEFVSLTGRQVPYHILARALFEGALSRYRLGDTVYFDRYMETGLGYKPGSPAAEAIVAAIEAYEDSKPSDQKAQSVEEELVALINDEPAYWARQRAWQHEKAAALGDLYRVLRESLEEVGSSMAGIERYIDERIAPSTNLVTDKPLDADFFAVNDTFEEHAGIKQGADR